MNGEEDDATDARADPHAPRQLGQPFDRITSPEYLFSDDSRHDDTELYWHRESTERRQRLRLFELERSDGDSDRDDTEDDSTSPAPTPTVASLRLGIRSPKDVSGRRSQYTTIATRTPTTTQVTTEFARNDRVADVDQAWDIYLAEEWHPEQREE